MKFTDFDFSFTKTDNNATLYFENSHSNDLRLQQVYRPGSGQLG